MNRFGQPPYSLLAKTYQTRPLVRQFLTCVHIPFLIVVAFLLKSIYRRHIQLYTDFLFCFLNSHPSCLCSSVYVLYCTVMPPPPGFFAYYVAVSNPSPAPPPRSRCCMSKKSRPLLPVPLPPTSLFPLYEMCCCPFFWLVSYVILSIATYIFSFLFVL